VRGLIAAFNDPVDDVRILALKHLATLQNITGMPEPLVAQFLVPTRALDTRVFAVLALGAIRAKSALVTLLHDSNPNIRDNALRQLSRLNAKDSAAAIASLLRDPKAKNSWPLAMETLGALRSKQYASLVATHLHDSPHTDADAVTGLRELDAWRERLSAARALGQMRATKYLGDIEMLGHDRKLSLEEVNEVIATMNGVDYQRLRASVQTVAAVRDLMDEQPLRRIIAANQFAAIADPAYADDVATLLSDADDRVRREAISALGWMRAGQYAKPIARFLNDTNPTLRAAAAQALGRMGKGEYAPAIAALLTDSDFACRAWAAFALGRMHATSYAPSIAPLIHDPTQLTASLAADALADMNATAYEGELVQLLHEKEDIWDLEWVLRALAKMHPVEYADDIASLLDRSDLRATTSDELRSYQAGLRERASDVLRAMHATGQIRQLSRVLTSSYGMDKHVLATLESFGPLSWQSIADVLATCYDDDASQAILRFACVYLSGGDPTIVRVLKEVAIDMPFTRSRVVADVRASLEAVHAFFPASRRHEMLAADIDARIYALVANAREALTAQDQKLLESLARDLDSAKSSRSAAFRQLLQRPDH
jgi:HEAT repeat protein